MATLSVKKSLHIATVALPLREFSFTSAARVFVAIGPGVSGDATLDHRSAELQPGLLYRFNSHAGSPFLDALSPDPASDATPVVVTYTDLGVAGSVG